jgi:hypothetical protein
MDGTRFDCITRSLTGIVRRRDALRTLAGSGLTTLAGKFGLDRDVIWAKRRCRRRLQSCGGKRKCCNASGLNRCQALVKPSCAQLVDTSKRRCCGQEGASCGGEGLTTVEANCQCCGTLCCTNGVCEGATCT